MENDPNKKESKGKRILKKAIRRNSKSNNSQSSALEPSTGASRSRSFEGRRRSQERAPEPDEGKLRKVVEIQESHEVLGETAAASKHGPKTRTSPRLADVEPIKKNLKRKLEEESGAGTSGTSTGTSDTDADDKDPSKDKKKKNRCAVCRKKVGLTGFECRCGGLFCAVHRYSDKHECSFDYRELGAQEIRRNNPVVVSQKIHKI